MWKELNMAEYLIRRFDNITQFVEASVKNARSDGSSHRYCDDYRDNWHGSKSFDESVRYATLGGWQPERLAHLRGVFDGILPRLRKFIDLNVEQRPDVSGHGVDVAMFLTGEPDHMFEWAPDEDVVTRRALCLVIGHSISFGCTAEELFIRGQAAIALVRSLSMLGYELEIWSEQTVGGWGGKKTKTVPDYYSVLTRIHAAGSIMDESAVEFAVGNPSWLRRLIFGLEEGESQAVCKRFGFIKEGGYGAPSGIHHANLVGADMTLDLGRTWFNECDGNVDEGAAFNWLVSSLKESGAISGDVAGEWVEE